MAERAAGDRERYEAVDAPRGATRRLSAIMFTDMVGYTALVQEDEANARRLRDRQRAVLDRHIPGHGGRILQRYGDGALSVFDSAVEAVAAAVAIQRDLGQEPRVPLRVGIHTGDVVHDEEGVFGDGVNVAARIQSLGVPGSVLVSAKVHDELRNQPAFTTVSLGEFNLKNVRHPIEVFAVGGAGITLPAAEALPARARPRRSVAVLPFVNMSQYAENEYFSDGITEELINLLARVNGLQVTARTSSFAFKGRQTDIRQIAKHLGVDTVLEGSVRKAADRIRVTAQLIEAETGYHLFSGTWDRTLADVFALQDELASAIVAAVQEQLGPERQAPLHVERTSPEAHGRYLRGLYEFNRWTPESARNAIRMFEEAIALDPAFASAHASLAQSHGYLAVTGQADARTAWRAAESAAEKAVSLDAANGDAQLALALVRLFFHWDFDGAYGRIQKALSLSPGSANTRHVFAIYLSIIGEKERAIDEIEHALRLDPLALPYFNSLAWCCLNIGRSEEAVAHCDRGLAMDPTFRSLIETRAVALALLDRTDEALRTLNRIAEITGDASKSLAPRGFILSRAGRMDEARAVLERIRERQARHPDLSLQIDFAILHLALGEVEEAIAWLDEAAERRLGEVLFTINSVLWGEGRGHPEFATFLARHGLDRIARPV